MRSGRRPIRRRAGVRGESKGAAGWVLDGFDEVRSVPAPGVRGSAAAEVGPGRRVTSSAGRNSAVGLFREMTWRRTMSPWFLWWVWPVQSRVKQRREVNRLLKRLGQKEFIGAGDFHGVCICLCRNRPDVFVRPVAGRREACAAGRGRPRGAVRCHRGRLARLRSGGTDGGFGLPGPDRVGADRVGVDGMGAGERHRSGGGERGGREEGPPGGGGSRLSPGRDFRRRRSETFAGDRGGARTFRTMSACGRKLHTIEARGGGRRPPLVISRLSPRCPGCTPSNRRISLSGNFSDAPYESAGALKDVLTFAHRKLNSV